jgi:hypothetical protein
MPATLAEVNEYRREMLEGNRLHITDWARDRARRIVLEPPAPLTARPLVEAAELRPGRGSSAASASPETRHSPPDAPSATRADVDVDAEVVVGEAPR